jgi:leucyl/phenylalanyl-tRNA---protein transferase
MSLHRTHAPLPWVGPLDPLPDASLARREPNGLLAAGLDLSARRLLEAYSNGIFPWYSDGQPVLWWSPDPRMVLFIDEFRLHRSLARTLRKQHGFADAGDGRAWAVTMNRCFGDVIRRCAAPRTDEAGTWITRDILQAYEALHRIGHAHSVEVWQGDALIGGLYGVSIGRMFYGESMFAGVSDASKVALASLVQALGGLGFRMIDCQQNTEHLASLGAREVPRAVFLGELARLIREPQPDWQSVSIELAHA